MLNPTLLTQIDALKARLECLSISDCFTSKLLANADRYSDPIIHSRDLIDLAFLRNEQSIPPLAILF